MKFLLSCLKFSAWIYRSAGKIWARKMNNSHAFLKQLSAPLWRWIIPWICTRAQRAHSAFFGWMRDNKNNPSSCLSLSFSRCRSAPPSLWSAVIQWWKLEDREWEGGCTRGALSRVCLWIILLPSVQVWTQIWHSFNIMTLLIHRFSSFSGEPVTLWLCETKEHADSLTHARPQRRDLWRPLWKLQSTVHTGDDQVSVRNYSMRNLQCLVNISEKCWGRQISWQIVLLIV